jgi:putative transposase
MKARQYSEEKIIAMLRKAEAGAKIADRCRKYGMSNATYYRWCKEYSGTRVEQAKSLKELIY